MSNGPGRRGGKEATAPPAASRATGRIQESGVTHTWDSAIPAITGPAAREVRFYDTRSARLTGLGDPGQRTDPVRVYVCGITPYDSSHLGHALLYVTFDLLRRVLTYAGYRTAFAQNITDVDDPLFEKARELGEDWAELGAGQVEEYRQTMAALSVSPPDQFVSVSEMITGIGKDAARLLDAGAGYTLDGTAYFGVSTQEALGTYPDATPALLTELAAERGGDPERPGKHNPLDAPLWVPSAADEPDWQVPGLSPGRPGWHLECVTIAGAALGGLPADIQGGGTDLIFPHHEISRQQAIALTGEPLASWYMHVGMLRLGGEKMSKSLGNLVLVRDLLADGHDAAAVRLALLSWHYRQETDWAPAFLDAATARLARWRQAAALAAAPPFGPAADQATAHLARDLDTGGAMAVLDGWCDRALAAGDQAAGDQAADDQAAGSDGPAGFAAYVRGVLGVAL
jgi:L-cysteine:1D-myo-inositol 2-amino-2-deoxy-alpha-D-glucopyranoside ligase